MTTTLDERIAEVARELQAANDKWTEIKTKLIACGEEPVGVSKQMLERIETAALARPSVLASFNGVRA